MASSRFISAPIALAALTTFLHCTKDKSSNVSSDKSCSGAQALQSVGLRGSTMAPKTLALTFDDGPGPRTRQLSIYLKNEGIQAAFFVNGRSMGPGSPEVLQQLVSDGHLVANHTETHRSLTGTATQTVRLSEAEVVQELADTDTKIDPFVPSKRYLFRPPFGDYDDVTFNALSTTPMNKYVGPILWDVGDQMDEAKGRAADWDCWQDGSDGKRLTMKACGDLYITEIQRATRGIVLMHDPFYNELDPEQLGTVDMVMYMVPILKDAGFTFTRADMVPEVAALLPPLPSSPEGADGAAAPGENTSSGAPATPENPCP